MTGNHPLQTFYYLVLSLALVGQSTAAYKWVTLPAFIPVWGELAVIAGFVVFLELGAVVLLREVVDRRGKGDAAVVPLAASAVLLAIAASITFAGHWGDKLPAQISAIAFAAVTVGGYVVFLITTDLSERPEFVRRRRVRSAIAEYVESLPGMSQRDKAVLLASTDADEIASRVTKELDNQRIAEMLSAAIAPSGWDVPNNPDRPRKPSPARPKPSPSTAAAAAAASPSRPDVATPQSPDAIRLVPGATSRIGDMQLTALETVEDVNAKVMQELSDMDQSGKSQAAIAREYGISTTQVSRLKQRLNDHGNLVRVNGSRPHGSD